MPILPGVCSVTFRALPPDRVIDLVARAGLRGIEWGADVHLPPGNEPAAAALRRWTEDAGLLVSSYGSYYRLVKSRADGQDFAPVLASAVALGAPVIRVWPGAIGSDKADVDYRRQAVGEAREIGKQAAAAGVAIAFEYHPNTLTDTSASAVALMREIDHPNVGSYWQPSSDLDGETNLLGLRHITPWLRNLHVHHVVGAGRERRRHPLAEGATEWRRYLAATPPSDTPRHALIEFTLDDSPESFMADARVLRQWLAELRPENAA